MLITKHERQLETTGGQDYNEYRINKETGHIHYRSYHKNKYGKIDSASAWEHINQNQHPFWVEYIKSL